MCQWSYSESKFKRFQLSSEKQLAKSSQKESGNKIPQKRSHCSEEEPGPSHVNKFQYCWRTQYNDETDLRAAGLKQEL